MYCRPCERAGKNGHRLALTDRMAELLGEGFTVAEFSRCQKCRECGSVDNADLRVSVRSVRVVRQR